MLEVSFTGWGNSWYVIFPEVHYSRDYYNYIVSEGEVTGKFLISDEDEAEYRLSNNFHHVHTMQPLLTEGSTISKLIEEGRIEKIDLDHVYFEVKQYRTIFSPIHNKNIFVGVRNEFLPIEPEVIQAELGKAEREYLMRTIGALSLLLVEKTGTKLRTGQRPNKLAIQREINDILSAMNLSTEGQGKSRLSDVLGEALKLTLED